MSFCKSPLERLEQVTYRAVVRTTVGNSRIQFGQ
jgi:hypothetical protein